MELCYRDLLEFAWKLNSGRWNPLATTAVVPFVMLIRTIFIPNLDCFHGETECVDQHPVPKVMEFLLGLSLVGKSVHPPYHFSSS